MIGKVTKKDSEMEPKQDPKLTKMDKKGIIFRVCAPDPPKITKMGQKLPKRVQQVLKNEPKMNEKLPQTVETAATNNNRNSNNKNQHRTTATQTT